jgi:hypothetical protein
MRPAPVIAAALVTALPALAALLAIHPSTGAAGAALLAACGAPALGIGVAGRSASAAPCARGAAARRREQRMRGGGA